MFIKGFIVTVIQFSNVGKLMVIVRKCTSHRGEITVNKLLISGSIYLGLNGVLGVTAAKRSLISLTTCPVSGGMFAVKLLYQVFII
jgi:hypothetical protein